jgi:DNA-binding response OmpR family regulator
MAEDTKPKILVVEDDLDLAEMLNAYLRVQNYDVMTAAWGKEAIELGASENLDLIVLDIRLPDIDGYEVCRQLRLQRKTQDTPIIFLTEKRDRVDKLQGLELGVVDYITKPFDIQELRLRIRNTLSRAVRHSHVNPVTDLAEGSLVDDKLTSLLHKTDWALLFLGIKNLSGFRELYGFVAADDVLRAVSLMIKNAVREHGGEDDYVGHIEPEAFVIVTTPTKIAEIREKVESRIKQSREYFYPLKDREKVKEAMDADHLKLIGGQIDHTGGAYDSVEALKAALQKVAVPE